MNKEVTYTGIVEDILDTSTTFITTGNTVNENYTVGALVKIDNIRRAVPLIKTDRIVTAEDLINAKRILKERYGIEKGKEFIFNIPDDRYLNDRTETTGYKQKVSGNVDNLLVFTSRTLFNNRIRKALLGQSRMLKEDLSKLEGVYHG